MHHFVTAPWNFNLVPYCQPSCILHKLAHFNAAIQYNTTGTPSWRFQNVKLLFIAITSKSTLTRNVRVSSMGQTELFNHLLRITIISNLKQYSHVQIVHICCNGISHTHSQSCGVTIYTVIMALYLSLLQGLVGCLTIPCLS